MESRHCQIKTHSFDGRTWEPQNLNSNDRCDIHIVKNGINIVDKF
jgi:hypothetical protein